MKAQSARPCFCRMSLNRHSPSTRKTIICIMTRGHKDDMVCEAFALRTPAHYIGVIGSKKKTASVNAQLKEQGFTDEDLKRVTTPIGLAIGAKTPAEIAVSITAQLIQVRAQRISNQ